MSEFGYGMRALASTTKGPHARRARQMWLVNRALSKGNNASDFDAQAVAGGCDDTRRVARGLAAAALFANRSVVMGSLQNPELFTVSAQAVGLAAALLAREEEQRLKSTRDSKFTNLLNATSFGNYFDTLYLDNQGRREQDRTLAGAFLLIDVDNFKHINETHGYAKSDTALAGVADVLEDVAGALDQGIRLQDLIGRFGGDEFVVAMAGIDPESAMSRAEEIRSTIANSCMGELAVGEITVSIGVLTIKRPLSFTQALTTTEEALKSAKRAGKNMVLEVPTELYPAPLAV